MTAPVGEFYPDRREGAIDQGKHEIRVKGGSASWMSAKLRMGEPNDDVSVGKFDILAAYTYDQVKRVVAMPSQWGAKISGEQFQQRADEALKKFNQE